jgi:hypothetical protein
MFRWDQPFVLDDRSIVCHNVHPFGSDDNPTPDDHPSACSDNVHTSDNSCSDNNHTSDDNPTPDDLSAAAAADVTPSGRCGFQLHSAE